MIGMILGNRYEILREIGSGGMANVYLAQCRLLNRQVAVKVLKNEFANDKEFLERFNKEAQAAAAISSPNIVNVYDVGHDGDIHYIVMEYVEGHTLKEYIDANGMLSWQETVEYAIQICSALDKAHKNGIVHRDIKPQNIILTNDGVLKVTDFGIARASSNETKNMGESTMGSVHYFSPEQARGGYTDAKSDIYSLGIVMYELITGILPFNGESPIAIAIKHMQEKPVSPKEFNISIPLAVESIILKAMSKEQGLRYQSAEEMLADLNKVMQKPSEQISSTPVNYGDTIKMTPVTPAQPAEPVQPEPTPYRPVHQDNRRAVNKGDGKQKKPMEKGSKRAVALAIVAAFAVIAGAISLVAMLLFGNGCSSGSKELEIPNLIGMNYENVMKKYSTEYGGDFEIVFIEEKSDAAYGTVLDQSPDPGTMVKGNKKITIKVAVPLESFIMPEYAGQTEEYFKDEFKEYRDKYGIKVITEQEPNLDVEKGLIIRTEPASGEMIDKDTEVTVFISAGGFEMEELVGITLADAKEWLEEKGLELGKITPRNGEDYYVVIGQSIDPGEPVAEGTVIDLELTVADEPQPSVNSKLVQIRVPQDRDSTVIRVLQDGSQIYNRRHDKSEEYIDVTIMGSGAVEVKVYFDGVLESSWTENL